MDPNVALQYAFYVVILLIAGAGEYLHIVPTGTLIGVLGLVTGHFFGNGSTKSAIAQITSALNSSTVVSPPSQQVVVTSGPVPLEEKKSGS